MAKQGITPDNIALLNALMRRAPYRTLAMQYNGAHTRQRGYDDTPAFLDYGEDEIGHILIAAIVTAMGTPVTPEAIHFKSQLNELLSSIQEERPPRPINGPSSPGSGRS